jgi:hypothetical protein
MIIRTILDLDHRSQKHLRLTLLLAASYHRFNAMNKSLTMEAWIIGSVPPTLEGFLKDLGITVKNMPISRLGDRIRTANKIPATEPDPTGRPLLLIDNDILCTGSLDELQQLSTGSIRAIEAAIMRVNDAQWDEIENKLGLRPLVRYYRNLRDYPPCEGATIFRKEHLLPAKRLYVNSGTLLIPPHLELRETWESNVESIYLLFKDHPLSSGAVVACDQTGLAVTLGSLGSFEFLPIEYNYVPYGFILGLLPEEKIRLMHMLTNPAVIPPAGIKSYLQNYWQCKIFDSLEEMKTNCPQNEISRRRMTAENILSLAFSVIDAYGLEDLYEKCAKECGLA